MNTIRRKLVLLGMCTVLCLPLLSAQEHADERLRTTGHTDTILIRENISRGYGLRRSDPDSAQRIFEEVLQQSSRIRYMRGITIAQTELGKLLVEHGQFDAALVRFYSALQYCASGTYLSHIYNNMGNALNQSGKLEQASRAYLTAAYYAEQYPSDITSISNVYLNLCTVFDQLGQKEKALHYIGKALPVVLQKKEHEAFANLLMLKGVLYFRDRDYVSGERYFDSAISHARTHGKYAPLHAALTNRGTLLLSAGYPDRALASLQEAEKTAAQHPVSAGNINGQTRSMGEAYLQLKRYPEAEQHLLKAYRRSDQLPKERMMLLKTLSELYDATGRSKQAYRLQQDYINLKDSISSKEVAIAVTGLETQYRAAEKDRKIAEDQLVISNQRGEIARKDLWMVLVAGGGAGGILVLTGVYLHLRQKNRLLRSSRRIRELDASIEGEERERVRLAQELHDGISSQIAGAQAYLLALGGRFPEVADNEAFTRTKDILSGTAGDVRTIAHNLMPRELTGENLCRMLSGLCADMAGANGIAVGFHPYGDFEDLSHALTLSIYRIVQELLRNVVKHAAASEVEVLLHRNEREISLIVEDNGKGMDPGTKAGWGIGLQSIQNRAKAHGGKMLLEPGPVKGTVVSVSLFCS